MGSRMCAQSMMLWHTPSALGAAGFLAALGFLAAAAFLGVFALAALGFVTCSTFAATSAPVRRHSQILTSPPWTCHRHVTWCGALR